MKRIVWLAPLLTFIGTAAGQDSGGSNEASAAGTASNGADLMRELWFMDDARPIETGRTDLRLTYRWETASAPANRGDSDDDSIVTPSLTWGTCDNVEVFVEVPVWVGDGGDKPSGLEGNADTTVGFTWRFMEPDDTWPAMALRGSARLPTGDNSNGVDGELRLIMTNEYDSGIRSHINTFALSVNGDNDENLRNFQWGFVAGLDGPLCADGAVRWVADYMLRSSFHNGVRDLNMLEVGWEWDMDEAEKLGMSVQIGLDDNDDTPNFGAAISYSHSLTY